jgi:hypothetical protein
MQLVGTRLASITLEVFNQLGAIPIADTDVSHLEILHINADQLQHAAP